MLRLRPLWRCCCTVILLALTACRTADALPPTPTTLRVIQATSSERDLHAVASPIPGTTPTDDSCEPSDGEPTTQHTVNATISYEQHRAVVDQRIHTINRSGDTWTQVVFDVEPNRFASIFTLVSATSTHGVTSYEITGRRLTLTLDRALMPGCALDLDLNFTLRVPEISGSGGYFGFSSHQLNLGQWLPMLALYRDGQWITHDVTVIGEQVVVEVADWDVTLTVSDAAPSLVVAAPGTLVDHDANQWHYTLDKAREFTVSLSPDYQVVTENTDSNVSVELYTFGDRTAQTASGTVDNAHQALHAAAQAIETYSNLYGSYPRERFVVVQSDYPDGTEFSGIVFVSDQWFRTNTGSAQSYLTIITVHETAHQWWYVRVGSDQATTPWMDEALAVYSEYAFYEARYPDLKQWWWNYRVDAYVGGKYSGKSVDSTVYDFETARDYINAVYLRGAHMLNDLRANLGADAFFDWLHRYVQAEQYQVATPDDFWRLLTADQLAATQATRVKYLSGEQS